MFQLFYLVSKFFFFFNEVIFIFRCFSSISLLFGVFSHEKINFNIVLIIFPSGLQYSKVHFWFNLYSTLPFSLKYNLAHKTCEFNNDTKYFRPKYFVEKPTFVNVDYPGSDEFRLPQWDGIKMQQFQRILHSGTRFFNY